VRRGQETASRWWQRTFRSLAVPNYRYYFIGQAVSVIGIWMQRVAQDWLVLEISDSAVAVGIAASLQFVPTLLFGIHGGVIVDRVDRRRAIIATQTAAALLAVVLAAVTLADLVTLWMIYALALALGFVTVVDVPARQAFVTEMVGPDDYVNAQALNSTIHNAGRLIGPAIAGVLIASVGAGLAFALNALSFVAVLIGLLRIDPGRLRRAPRVARSRGQAVAGLKYVWSHPELRACMILVAVVALFGQNFRVVLPVLARETFDGGAETYGWLTSALGAGAVMGALFSATRQTATAWALLWWTFAFAAANALGAVSPVIAIALTAMVALDFANISFNTLARTLLQLGTEPSMQGRVIALHSFVFLGSTPIGGPLLGWVCQAWGARAGLGVASVTAALVAVALLPRLRALRSLPRTDKALDGQAG
jgi:predicted MFS family arabinose efflux permease